MQLIDGKATAAAIKAEIAEGYFQAMFFSKKMVSPYRPNNSHGTRDLCDECYRLNDADIAAIKTTLAKIK